MTISRLAGIVTSLLALHNHKSIAHSLTPNHDYTKKRRRSLFIWGENEDGLCTPLGPSHPIRVALSIDLTNGTTDEIKGRAPLNVKSISTCNNHIAAVDENGDVWQWGSGTPFQEPVCTLKGHSVVCASA